MRSAGNPPLTTTQRLAILRSVTLLHELGQRLVLHEPSEAELAILQREMLKRVRQLVTTIEHGLPRKASTGENVVTFKETRQRRLRRLSAIFSDGHPEPPGAA